MATKAATPTPVLNAVIERLKDVRWQYGQHSETAERLAKGAQENRDTASALRAEMQQCIDWLDAVDPEWESLVSEDLRLPLAKGQTDGTND